MTENCLSCSVYYVLICQVNGNYQKASIFFRSEVSCFVSLQSEGKQTIIKTIEKGKTAFAKIGMDSPTRTDLSIPYIFSSEFSEIPFIEWKHVITIHWKSFALQWFRWVLLGLSKLPQRTPGLPLSICTTMLSNVLSCQQISDLTQTPLPFLASSFMTW